MLLPLLAILAFPAGASAQDNPILQLLYKQAEVIVHVRVLNADHGISINNIGSWETPVALCVVEESIKGDLKQGEQITFSYYRSNRSERKGVPALVRTGAHLIVFLQTAKADGSGQTYSGEMIDKWAGVILYQTALAHSLKEID